ncbi:MAG: META domain-containing protein [Dysgonomonas sp.]
MKTRTMTKLFALCAAVLGLFSLQSCNNTKPVDPSELGGYWILKTMNGQDAKTLFEGALPTIQFDFDKMMMYGTGGCNRYTGTFSFEKNVVTAPNLATTRMLCVGKNEEAQFLLELSKPNTISIVNGILTFADSDKKVIFEFEKGEAPKSLSEQLAGTWTLKLMEGDEASKTFKSEGKATLPTLIFNANENKINGNAGCNNYFATYSLDQQQLIVGPIGSTEMACPNMQGEAIFIKNLSDTSTVSLPNENVLQISKQGKIVLEFEKTENAE